MWSWLQIARKTEEKMSQKKKKWEFQEPRRGLSKTQAFQQNQGLKKAKEKDQREPDRDKNKKLGVARRLAMQNSAQK